MCGTRRTWPRWPDASRTAPSTSTEMPVLMKAAASTLVRLPNSELTGGCNAINAPTARVARTASRRVMALHSATAALTLPNAMTVPESFPAFLATRGDDEVERGPATLAASDLPDGEVTIRVRWSSINYKDALATIAKGQVARVSPLVPGVDLAGEVVASADETVPVGSEVVVTGYDLGVGHHGGWALYARVPAGWVVPLPGGLSARQAM